VAGILKSRRLDVDQDWTLIHPQIL